MRGYIQKILKETRDYHASVFLIMSEDEKFVKYNLHVAGENYFSGGPNEDGWEPTENLNDKTFREFYVNQKSNAEGIISILPQTQLDMYKPKVVEYVMGYFRKDDMNNVFDQLTESNQNTGSMYNPKVGDFIMSKKVIMADKIDPVTTVGRLYTIKRVWTEGGRLKISFMNDNEDRHQLHPPNDFFREYFDYVPKEYVDTVTNFDPFEGLNESEENDFEWVEDSNEPFHHVLMRDNDREPMLMDEIDRIMFNPPVSTEDERFLKIAYWLEDNDYYPESIEVGRKTSYIEMTKQKHQRQSGRWKIGPELSDEELYQLSQTPRRGTWNGNFWAEQFYNRFMGGNPKQQWFRVN